MYSQNTLKTDGDMNQPITSDIAAMLGDEGDPTPEPPPLKTERKAKIRDFCLRLNRDMANPGWFVKNAFVHQVLTGQHPSIATGENVGTTQPEVTAYVLHCDYDDRQYKDEKSTRIYSAVLADVLGDLFSVSFDERLTGQLDLLLNSSQYSNYLDRNNTPSITLKDYSVVKIFGNTDSYENMCLGTDFDPGAPRQRCMVIVRDFELHRGPSLGEKHMMFGLYHRGYTPWKTCGVDLWRFSQDVISDSSWQRFMIRTTLRTTSDTGVEYFDSVARSDYQLQDNQKWLADIIPPTCHRPCPCTRFGFHKCLAEAIPIKHMDKHELIGANVVSHGGVTPVVLFPPTGPVLDENKTDTDRTRCVLTYYTVNVLMSCSSEACSLTCIENAAKELFQCNLDV